MISSISISNFQSHADTKLELFPGVNAIIGQSDSGKTAILRAINWLINNRPSGEGFRSNWGGDTIIDIDLGNYTVTREKSKEDGNCYHLETRLGQPNSDGDSLHSFTAFKQDVPQEIAEALNFSSINIQTQHDASFLLSNSSGEVARYLNQIVNLDKIDSALSNIAKKVRSENQALQNEQSRLSDLDTDLLQYDWIDGADGELEKLESLEVEIDMTEERYNDLNTLILKIEEITRQIKIHNNILKAEPELVELEKLSKEIEKTSEDIDILNELLNQISDSNEYIAQAESKIIRLEKEFKQLFPNQCPLCGQGVKNVKS
jgi:DNA repair exonuclease SbcCD ATPase subunit